MKTSGRQTSTPPATSVAIAALLAGSCLVLGLSAPTRACTTFCLQSEDQLAFGKNYDWSTAEGLLVVNQRGVTKTSAAARDGGTTTWESRYGSVTFNQFGREFPSGGINEAGLVLELMWLDETTYPARDERAALGNLQWIQYQLDLCASVTEILATDEVVRISASGPAKIHFLVCDATGQVAALEYLDGRLVAHTQDALPVPALTNDPYERSLSHLRATADALPRSKRSLDRFVIAARGVQRFTGQGSAVDHAFTTLRAAANGDATKWSIVYDVANLRVHFATLDAPRRRHLALADLDFTCGPPALVVDLNLDLTGDLMPHLVTYSRQANRRSIARAFRQVDFLKDLPAEAIDAQASYPETTGCDAEVERARP